MLVNKETCIDCQECIPYCPVWAIKVSAAATYIDQELCVECGACLRSEVCPTQSLFIQELSWPRTIRAAFSGTNCIGYDEVLRKKPMPKREFETAKHWGGGRGTSEMKTNDVTNNFNHGEVGIGCEFGRPGIAFYFRDIEKLTQKLSENKIDLMPENPVSKIVDPITGKIKDEYKAIRNEKALSAIVEFKVGLSDAIKILSQIRDISREIETVMSINIINRCRNGKIPFRSMLEEAGIAVAINGKTCIGLGRIPV